MEGKTVTGKTDRRLFAQDILTYVVGRSDFIVSFVSKNVVI